MYDVMHGNASSKQYMYDIMQCNASSKAFYILASLFLVEPNAFGSCWLKDEF